MFKSKLALIMAVLLLVFVGIMIVVAVAGPAGGFSLAYELPIKLGHACSSGCAI